ncbi:Glycolipid 2-alpha-mannosyltransferase [Nakaseomyces bracarensis]|uniref:Glycolipid 2-alpha-mannosyltransferase n=1 Tax=Nakaseomyces bracarensis TaxID=273131 RepID=A0ABR4NXZ0_9SACH
MIPQRAKGYLRYVHRHRVARYVVYIVLAVTVWYSVTQTNLTDKLVVITGPGVDSLSDTIRSNYPSVDLEEESGEGQDIDRLLQDSLELQLDKLISGDQNVTLDQLNNVVTEEEIANMKKLNYKHLLNKFRCNEKSTVGYISHSLANEGLRPKACIYTFIKSNSQLRRILRTVESVQKNFNHAYGYPWVFISAEKLSEAFKATVQEKLTEFSDQIDGINTEAIFGLVPDEIMEYPAFIDSTLASNARIDLFDVPHGDEQYYRFIARFHAGFVANHTLLKDYDWFLRVDAGLKMTCMTDYDIFRWMQDNSMAFAFGLSLREDRRSDSSFYKAFQQFTEKNSEIYKAFENRNMAGYLIEGGNSFTHCSYSTELQIMNLNFLRSPGYQKYFKHIDEVGGIFYERWSDSLIIGAAVSTLIPASMTHHLSHMGFQTKQHIKCPKDNNVWMECQCNCDQGSDMTTDESITCMNKYNYVYTFH